MRSASLPILLVVSTACSQSHQADANDPCSDGGRYERINVTDEACRAFVEAESRGQVVVDGARAPSWTMPQARVPASPPPRLIWTKGTLARAWSFLKSAWAHGDTTGDAFVLSFRDGAGKELHRALTTNTEYTPSSAVWGKISAGRSFTVTLIGVRFTRNTIATGTKPTAAPPLSVTVE